MRSDESLRKNFRGLHNSPKDRGSADRYYGRQYNPHYWCIDENNMMGRVQQGEMTEQQVAEYRYGFETEQDRDEGVY